MRSALGAWLCNCGEANEGLAVSVVPLRGSCAVRVDERSLTVCRVCGVEHVDVAMWRLFPEVPVELLNSREPSLGAGRRPDDVTRLLCLTRHARRFIAREGARCKPPEEVITAGLSELGRDPLWTFKMWQAAPEDMAVQPAKLKALARQKTRG